jgi:peroxiredoxin
MANLPQQGDSLPDLDLTTESGEHVDTAGLTGQKTVLYFYPKDDTPGCTKEACAFRDRMQDYVEAGIQVHGVSFDSPESHREFARSTTSTSRSLRMRAAALRSPSGCYASTGKARTALPSCSPLMAPSRRPIPK